MDYFAGLDVSVKDTSGVSLGRVLRRLLLGTDGAVVRSGVMNVVWILALALGILLERVTSFGRLIAPLAGIVLIAAGVWLFATAMPYAWEQLIWKKKLGAGQRFGGNEQFERTNGRLIHEASLSVAQREEPEIEISPEADAAMRKLKELFSDPAMAARASSS
jgi:hypothetical protein